MPSNFTFKAVNAVHRALLCLSFGRAGTEYYGMPALELTTTGRKSGRPHSVMLTAPIVEGDEYVIVASRGGEAHHPAWYRNLCDEPAVQVSFRRGPRTPMTAHVLTSEQRTPLWSQIVADHSVYADYQKRTDREIPLVRLTPARESHRP